MDVLLQRLEGLKLGCHVGHVFMGAFGYADDIIILSPMKRGLMEMLKICDLFSIEYHVNFMQSYKEYFAFLRDPRIKWGNINFMEREKKNCIG
jgi:hypothetical protein